jgi:hypothetical protein
MSDRERVIEIGKAAQAISNLAFDNCKLSDDERMSIFRGIDIIGDALRLHHRRIRNLQMSQEEHIRRLTLLRSPIMREDE